MASQIDLPELAATEIPLEADPVVCARCGVTISLDAHVEKHIDNPALELTPMERVVTRLLLSELDQQEIASILNVRLKAFKHHVNTVYRKFQISTRAELFAYFFPLRTLKRQDIQRMLPEHCRANVTRT